MSRTLRGLIAAAGVSALALAAVAASPSFEWISIGVHGDTIEVTGGFAEDLAPILIGTDANGDALTTGLGMDVVEYAVSFPDATTVAFHVALGDANPATGYFPQGTAFEIAPSIGDTSVELTAVASVTSEAINGGLRFGAQTCEVNPDTGVNECSTTPIEGEYADGVVTWFYDVAAVPNTSINGNHVHVNYSVGTFGTPSLTFTGGLIDDMAIMDFAAMPSATLLVDGAVAGVAGASSEGFAVSASGLADGEHAVSLQVCSGAADFNGTPEDCTVVDFGTITIS